MKSFATLAMVLVLILASASLTLAQISSGGTPYSFSSSLTEAVPTLTMPPVDVAQYLLEDSLATKDVPFRFGAGIEVAYDLANSGVWSNLPDGSRLWRLRIVSSGAYSVNLLYDRFYMPPGATFFLYSDDHSKVLGAFTAFNNFETGAFATAPLAGDAITLEYQEPAGETGRGIISIYKVVHAYRNVFGNRILDDFGGSGSCNNNVNCPVGYNWQSDKRGVAMIISGGTRICTGSLINNASQDQTPYFLTANHCLGGETTWMFVFNYESPACSNVNGPTGQTVSNATRRANNSASDFALLQLSSNVPLSYAPYFNGWNNVNVAADSSTVIHHPEGDIKKISFDRDPPVSSTWSGTPANSHWRILAYESGTTEPGSSGSPLFDQNHHIIGQLHGGTASCSNNIDDYYGKFSMSWNQGSTAATRLRDWLDPGNTHTTLDGYSPVSITLVAPNGGEIWPLGSNQTITWTSTNLTQNIKIELNRTYPTGTWETIVASTANTGSYSWLVSGAASTTARVRISGVTAISLNEISASNFTITSGTPSLSVTVPNGGENWYVGDTDNITWTSQFLSENVKIELKRSYPGGSWETLVASTPNTGSYAWSVAGASTSTARVRITGTVSTTVGDTSNANFSILARSISVTSPNGGESWAIGELHNITWSSVNVSGTVSIDLNRDYPAGFWESVAANVANSGSYSWAVTASVTALARVRVTSDNAPSIADTSNGNFSIVFPNQPPVLAHDPLHDQDLTPFSVTAIVTDDAGGFSTKFFYRPTGSPNYDSLALTSTGNPNEFAVNVGPLAEGSYDYFLKTVDAGGLSASTALFVFEVGSACGNEQAYDDGTDERSNWSPHPGFQWAVKFNSGATPFVLCAARVGISSDLPDVAHSPIQVQVILADGLGGLPGTVVQTRTVGSIGNVIGGLQSSPANWAPVVFRDGTGNPLQLNDDFYIAVSNPDSTKKEAFLQDTSSAYAGRSYVYDPCLSQWYNESVTDSVLRRGNRLIRVSGFSLVAPADLVIRSSGSDTYLYWSATGAPYYKVFSALVPDGPFTTLEGSTAVLSFIDSGALSDAKKFYIVVASTTP